MKKPEHYHEKNRINISYFKTHVGYLTPRDRRHNTTQVLPVRGQETDPC